MKRLVGYLPENVGFYEDMTAEQNLAYVARLNGIEKGSLPRKIEGLLGKSASWPKPGNGWGPTRGACGSAWGSPRSS